MYKLFGKFVKYNSYIRLNYSWLPKGIMYIYGKTEFTPYPLAISGSKIYTRPNDPIKVLQSNDAAKNFILVKPTERECRIFINNIFVADFGYHNE
jgi:hypothetical protein